MLRNWRRSLSGLATLAAFVLLNDLRPKAQEVTWGCGGEISAPAGVHLPLAATPSSGIMTWHVIAAALIAAGALLLLHAILLLVGELRYRPLSATRGSAGFLSLSLSVWRDFQRIHEFLLGFSVVRRGPPVWA